MFRIYLQKVDHTTCFEWMDGWIRSGQDKLGPQIGPNVLHTDEKLKDLIRNK
jgi:hypothetical protein